MKIDLPSIYSAFYGKVLTDGYRRDLLAWLHENNTAAFLQVCKDHKTKLEDHGLGWMKRDTVTESSRS